MTGRRAARWLGFVVGYFIVSGLLLGPLMMRLGQVVPGAARSDVWNALWSLWFVSESLAAGGLPWQTTLLDHPGGGVLFVADPLGALLATPLARLWGVETAYGIVVWIRVALAGLSAHWLVEEVLDHDGEGWLVPCVAGFAMMTAPVLVSGIHNGTSEAVALAPVALSTAAALRAMKRARFGWVLLSALLLVFATLASGYAAVLAFVFVGSMALFLPIRWGIWREVRLRAGVVGLGLVGALPVARLVATAASTPGNLVGIKHPMELATVRRSTGPADPLSYFVGFDFRSPDFRSISRYGEDFIHCTYIGWVLLLVVAWGLWHHRSQLRGMAWLLVAGGVAFLLSLGPVIVHDGFAWVFLDDRVWPMPYLLLERLPGLGSLSLLWRLGAGPALACAVLAAWSLRRRGAWWAVAVMGLVWVETQWVAPTGALPAYTDARVHSALVALRDAPDGAVLNHPVVGGRAYLHEQTAHGQPLAGRLNFPNNVAGRAVWEAARKATSLDDIEGRKVVRKAAEQNGVRYVVLHDDAEAGPDMYDDAAKALQARFPALAHDGPLAETGPHGAEVVVLRLF